jgi:sulfur carrier protein ThiS
MPEVKFTQNLERHLSAPAVEVVGATVREALDQVFERNPQLRSYVLDDQGRLRKHVVVFVDGELVEDRVRLSDPVEPGSELFVMQALSGG